MIAVINLINDLCLKMHITVIYSIYIVYRLFY